MQKRQFLNVGGRQYVRAGAEHLAELDKGWTQFLQCQAEVFGQFFGRYLGRLTLRQAQAPAQGRLELLQRKAKPVPDKGGADLIVPANVLHRMKTDSHLFCSMGDGAVCCWLNCGPVRRQSQVCCALHRLAGLLFGSTILTIGLDAKDLL